MISPSLWDAATEAAVVLGAQTLGAWGWWRLRRTPEPAADDATGWVKPRYREVADARMLAGVLAVGGVLAALALTARPVGLPDVARLPVVMGWAAAAGLGTVAIGCDLRTTYLPSSLMRPWALVTAGTVLGCWGVGLVSGAHLAMPVARVVVCVVAARLVFWGLWRVGGRFGYGDVRLATILAADAALVSATTWSSWLVAGTTTGALWAGITLTVRRRRPNVLGTAFAYGPSLAIGAWVALALS